MTETQSVGVLTYEEAKVFIRAFEKKTNANMRKLKTGERVSYALHEADKVHGRFTYNYIVNKELHSRVVVARGPKGEAKIISEYHVTRTRLHADLNIGKRVEVKKSEKRWTTR